MKTRPPRGSTTHPSGSTGAGRPGGSSLVVCWVHPSLRVTPLVDGAVLGRDASSSVVLEGSEASRRHAAVKWTGALPTLHDLGSRNGTWVDRRRVTEGMLGPGCVVRIGEWVGVVLEVPPGPLAIGFGAIGEGWFGGPTLARAVADARRAAPTDLPVIAQGETGSGKEGLARTVHAWSGRPGPFVAVNCAAIPAAMAEGELFGYRKGAFTGADQAAPGFFRAAHRGTLFLDEILELPAALQAKLLRVLEQREVQPLGESRPVAVDVRVVCATQEPLGEAVAARRFRADLLARLDGLTVRLPPLRGRREDIAPLFLQLARGAGSASPLALEPKMVEALLAYDWPLNVRELALLARRLVALHGNAATWTRSMLPERMLAVPHRPGAAVATPAARVALRVPVADAVAFERLVEALRQHGGNVSRAAAALGITRARAYRLLEARPGFDLDTLRDGDR